MSDENLTLDETAVANAMDLLECSVSNYDELVACVRFQFGQAVLDEATKRLG